ncbi:MAG: site-specific integrase [Paramuribaculum sp.]|nr:site-specific integrase [Paramuribaculum sp.]
MKIDIRKSKTEGEASLYTRMRIAGKSEWINLYLKVDIEKWNEVKDSERKRQNFLDKKGYSRYIVDIEFGIKELKRKSQDNMENVDTLIKDIVLKEQRQALVKQQEIGKKLEERKRKSVKTYIINYVNGMESGEERNGKGEIFGIQTIKAWKQFRRIFLDFYDNTPFTWEEIDQKLINRFISYLEKCDYMKKTRSKYLKSFKQLISDAEKRGLHKNNIAKNLIRGLNIKESDKTKKIYLTKEELDALYNMELEGYERIVRDVFLIGCYTAQRYSDFFITESCIGTTAKGVRVIRMEQEKTGNMVVIPIMDDRLEVLLKAYNYNVPKIADQNINRTIKEIGRKLSKTVPSLAVKERTLLTLQEKQAEKSGRCKFERDSQGYVIKPKWQMIGTHTARRSAITNMYLSDKYTIPQIMSVSGHKDERTFKEYVKLSLDEKAEELFKSSKDGMF